jgi:hypothetical protein
VVVVVSQGALRYVVLRHEGVESPHFDVMFELSPGGPLATWRASTWPASTGNYFVRLPEHRNTYLEYEGPISGGRGEVRRVDAGTVDARLTDVLLEVTFPDGRELTLVQESPERWYCAVVEGRR